MWCRKKFLMSWSCISQYYAVYSVSQKILVFWHFFLNVWEFLVQILQAYYTSLSTLSGVPRILQWEGSRCRRRRGGKAWGGDTPSLLGEGSGKGAVPPPSLPPKLFVFFCWKHHFWRILPRLFLKSYANGRGSNPLTPSSVRHCLR